MVALVLFCVCVGAILFTYIGYPLLLVALTGLQRPRHSPEMTEWPRLSALIVAHNEEDCICDKIDNILTNGYPADKLEVIVCSDGSTDDTNRLVEQYSDGRVKLVASPGNIGVNEAFALGADQAGGDLLLMTDAGALFEDQAISKAVGLFGDPQTGVATGRILYGDPFKTSVGHGYAAYWSIENRVRQLEARLGLAVVIVGAFEVIRKEAYLPVPSQFSNDMTAPMYARSKGFMAGFEPGALLVATQTQDPRQEFQSRLRMAIRGWSSIPYMLGVVPFFRNLGSWLALISHKYLRWSTWAFMIGAFTASGLLWQRPLFRAVFMLQLVFYAMAAAGWLLARKGIRVRLLSLPFYFCLLQAAGMVGLIQALCGRTIRSWKPIT